MPLPRSRTRLPQSIRRTLSVCSSCCQRPCASSNSGRGRASDTCTRSRRAIRNPGQAADARRRPALGARLLPAVLRDVDAVTKIDSQVYRAAVVRLLCDVAALEMATGRVIVSPASGRAGRSHGAHRWPVAETPSGHNRASSLAVAQHAALIPSGREPKGSIGVTAAEASPPRPLGFFDGSVVSLTSVNFAPKLLHARPSRVTIDHALPATVLKARGLPDATSFLVRSAVGRCGSSATFADAFFLESCAYPGLLLAHSGHDDAPLRLALDEPAATTTAAASAAASHCRAGLLFEQLQPGLAGEGTVSLLAARPPSVRDGSSRALAARHAWSRLKLTSANLGAPDADPTLRDDGSWKLTPPADPSCHGRVRVAAPAEAADRGAAARPATAGRADGQGSLAGDGAGGSAAGAAAAAAGGDAAAAAAAASPHGANPTAIADELLARGASTSTVAAALAKPTHSVALHISIGGKPTRLPLRFELFGRIAPRTVENFVQLCNGDGKYKYQGTDLQRIIPGFMAQGGSTDGGYGQSANGGRFADESFALSHDAAGVLSMANAGEDTNASQFFILFNPQPHLDGKHVVFGRMAPLDDDGASSLAVLHEIESVGSRSGATQLPVKIATCTVKAV